MRKQFRKDTYLGAAVLAEGMPEIMVFTTVLVNIAYPELSIDAFHSRLGSVKLVGRLPVFQVR